MVFICYLLNVIFILNQSMKSEAQIMFGPGDCIGDLEMIDECERMHTFITRCMYKIIIICSLYRCVMT